MRNRPGFGHMPPDQFHALASMLAKILEIAGAIVIVGAAAIVSVRYVVTGLRSRDWREGYEAYRSDLGRGILLGLELLVGADIISTITAPLTYQSVGLLGAIVAIRTILSFSLETEIEGCWPWERRKGNEDKR
jgi:uncharacterized membrane protein